MSAAQRVKGRRGEAEVAAILRGAGFTVRGLESGGDHLAVGHGLTLHVEVKRQERGWRTAWGTQAMTDAPPGASAVVIYRRSREPWQLAERTAHGWAHMFLNHWLASVTNPRVREALEKGQTCPRCGDLSLWAGTTCAHCGARLHVLESPHNGRDGRTASAGGSSARGADN